MQPLENTHLDHLHLISRYKKQTKQQTRKKDAKEQK